MNSKQLLDIIENIDDKYIEEAAPKSKKSSLIKFLTAAACAVIVLLIAVPIIKTVSASQKNIVNLGSVVREYEKYGKAYPDEIEIEWPWEYRRADEKYTCLIFNKKEYSPSMQKIEEGELDSKLGESIITGYNEMSKEKQEKSADVYKIKNVNKNYALAVEIENEYYIYKNIRGLQKPKNLSELIKNLDLTQNLKLSYFALTKDGECKGNFEIENDKELWNMILKLGSAELLREDESAFDSSETVEFSATSDTLGFYRKNFIISRSGYLRTNICEWGYDFFIGKENAEKIIDYALKKGKKAEPLLYEYTLIGKVKEIKDDCAIIDDSVLKRNPKKGMQFILPLDDIRIYRYFKLEKIKEGDIIAVGFRGGVEDRKIIEPTRIYRAYITDENSTEE